MSDALVIIPTYNEKENIEVIIKATFNQEKAFHILVVDDDDGRRALEHGVDRLLRKGAPSPHRHGHAPLESRLGRVQLIHAHRAAIRGPHEGQLEEVRFARRGRPEERRERRQVAHEDGGQRVNVDHVDHARSLDAW